MFFSLFIFKSERNKFPSRFVKEFREKLSAKTIIVNNKGHISQDDNIYELQEILNLGKEMLGE